jgi:putative membrane protein
VIADSASPSVQLHQLLASWQLDDPYAAVAFAIDAVAVAWYLAAVRRLNRRGRSWPWQRTAAYLAGVAVLVLAVTSGLASYDDSVFTVHIVQHLLLMMVAPPLLALGAPITLAVQASGRRLQTRLVHLLHSRPLRLLTFPLVAATLYYLSMYVELLTPVYPYTVDHPLAHSLTHVVMFTLGCLYWWAVLAVDRLPSRPAFPLRLVALFMGMPFEAFLGIAIMNRSTTIAPEHTLADTHAGGAVFWAASMLVTLGASMVVLSQWMRSEERQAAREDRRAGAAEDRRLEYWNAARAAKGLPVAPGARGKSS